MAKTVIEGSPHDPLEEFRSQPLPQWERGGEYRDVIYEVAEGIAILAASFPLG